VLFVAIAIVNIQDQRVHDPILVGVAIAGFALYALIGWGAWRYARRFEPRLGPVWLLCLYLAGMAGVFLIATVFYLLIEHSYLIGFR
jgi:hypothetical protein